MTKVLNHDGRTSPISTSNKRKPPDLDSFDAILLDVGNVIIYDFPVELAYSFFVNEEIRNRGFNCEQTASEIICSSRNQVSLRGLEEINLWREIDTIAWNQVLDNWSAFCFPIPGAVETLHKLSSKRLVIPANQPKELLPVFQKWGYTIYLKK